MACLSQDSVDKFTSEEADCLLHSAAQQDELHALLRDARAFGSADVKTRQATVPPVAFQGQFVTMVPDMSLAALLEALDSDAMSTSADSSGLLADSFESYSLYGSPFSVLEQDLSFSTADEAEVNYDARTLFQWSVPQL